MFDRTIIKNDFRQKLTKFVETLKEQVSSEDLQWTIKGFIDIYRNVYTISADTKIVSKILEIHIFPKLFEFAEINSYKIVLPEHQNYYPDITFISKDNDKIKFAVDLKTTYRLGENTEFCNGFTLGSHGTYFTDRNSKKNIQFPYNVYLAHFCLGIIYTRTSPQDIDETRIYKIENLKSIVSVIKDFQFFVCEKWELASDSSGSGNTANIGSIVKILDILQGNGVFKNLGKEWFDDYWMNYGKIIDPNTGKKITHLRDFIIYKTKSSKKSTNMLNKIIPCIRANKNKKAKNNL